MGGLACHAVAPVFWEPLPIGPRGVLLRVLSWGLRLQDAHEVRHEVESAVAETAERREDPPDPSRVVKDGGHRSRYWPAEEKPVNYGFHSAAGAVEALLADGVDDVGEDDDHGTCDHVVVAVEVGREPPEAEVRGALCEAHQTEADAEPRVRVEGLPQLHEVPEARQVQQLSRNGVQLLELAALLLARFLRLEAAVPVGLRAQLPGLLLGGFALLPPALARPLVVARRQAGQPEERGEPVLLELLGLLHVVVVVARWILWADFPGEQSHCVQEGGVLPLHGEHDRQCEVEYGDAHAHPKRLHYERRGGAVDVGAENRLSGDPQDQRCDQHVVVDPGHGDPQHVADVIAGDCDPTQVIVLVLIRLGLPHLDIADVSSLVVGGPPKAS
mmetsp:Transcript_119561/g.333605  ORF Transcript_119561/g.333605 Transcript_119561/m.333605 type:complete len:386 (+) Transcript_119561:1110-2267(+)